MKNISGITECHSEMLPIRDALDIVGGKWRILVLIAIGEGNVRFKDILNRINGLSSKVLASELKFLEANFLIERKVDDCTMIIEYHLTSHAYSLRGLVQSLREWGSLHREKIISS